MNPRTQNLILAFATALFIHPASAKSPNFILIYADDLGYADTSVRMMASDPSPRHSFIKPPGLARLAELTRRPQPVRDHESVYSTVKVLLKFSIATCLTSYPRFSAPRAMMRK